MKNESEQAIEEMKLMKNEEKKKWKEKVTNFLFDFSVSVAPVILERVFSGR